jgi:hypothetical protein
MRRKIKRDDCIVPRARRVCRTDSLHPPAHTVTASVFQEAIKRTLHYAADISNTDDEASAAVGLIQRTATPPEQPRSSSCFDHRVAVNLYLAFRKAVVSVYRRIPFTVQLADQSLPPTATDGQPLTNRSRAQLCSTLRLAASDELRSSDFRAKIRTALTRVRRQEEARF